MSLPLKNSESLEEFRARRRYDVKTSTIHSTWLPKGGYRLDCSPYFGGAIEIEILLEELPVRKDALVKVTKAIFNGPKFSKSPR